MNIKYYILIIDSVSIANASSGFLSNMITIGNYALATKFILLAVIFDVMDGRVARKLKRGYKHSIGKFFRIFYFIVMLIYISSKSYKFINHILRSGSHVR